MSYDDFTIERNQHGAVRMTGDLPQRIAITDNLWQALASDAAPYVEVDGDSVAFTLTNITLRFVKVGQDTAGLGVLHVCELRDYVWTSG